MNPRALLLAGALLALVATGSPVVADQDDPRLVPLFESLRAAPDLATAQRIEADIWRIWLESGDDDVDRLVKQGIEAMSQRRYEAALGLFDEVVGRAPGFAEGWNKRATVLWLMDRLVESVADIRHTLALEPRHFGALSGMGLIFLESGDATGALGAFEAVLAISPQSPGARVRVERLREHLRDRQI